jgi:SNF2 family DNA or RNA helicase
MTQIYESRGIIYLANLNHEFDWITYDTSTYPYFILNTYTRARFKRDIVPLIKRKEATISKELYDKIRYYVCNPVNTDPLELETLPGITYKEHQEVALSLMLKYNKYGFFLGPGSGKTIIALGFLKTTKPKTALIVTPQKVVAQYQAELTKYLGENPDYIVTNYEQLHKYTDTQFECLILDESHKAKSYMSNTNINCRKIAANCKYVYLFTGTPQDKSRHEILSQLAILDIRVMPVKTKTLLRYFNIDDYFQPSTEKRAFSEELTDIINRYTWGKKTEDVVQLTKENTYIYSCERPTEYNILLKDRVYAKEIQGERYRCVADNKGVLKIKLRELCNGHIELECPGKGTTTAFVYADKSEKLKELLIHTLTRGILYYEFTNDLFHIQNVLMSLDIPYRIINGSTNKKLIPTYIQEFKDNKCDILVMQSKSGNAGLDLTNVNDIIFYSLPESYIIYTQCKARINRIGQTKECNYHYLICSNSIEEQMMTALNKKRNFSTRLFKIYN